MTQTINEIDLTEIKENLGAERERLLASLTPEGGENGRSRNPDRNDLAQDYSRRERNLALQTIEEDVLTQIESALERIEAGTYGRCQECGQSIMPERLKILPYATLCVNCQSAQEKNYGTV